MKSSQAEAFVLKKSKSKSPKSELDSGLYPHVLKRGLSTREASIYLGASYSQLKDSRSTGKLWGQPAPRYKQMGAKKIIYDIKLLDQWFDAIPDDIYTGEQPAQLKAVKS